MVFKISASAVFLLPLLLVLPLLILRAERKSLKRKNHEAPSPTPTVGPRAPFGRGNLLPVDNGKVDVKVYSPPELIEHSKPRYPRQVLSLA